jgi:DNA-binding transcriptional LysR family regulator
VRGVLDGTSDMGIIAEPLEAAGLQVLHFSTDERVLMVPVDHPLANQPSVKLDEPWAIRERSILVRELETLPSTLRALIATLMPQSA